MIDRVYKIFKSSNYSNISNGTFFIYRLCVITDKTDDGDYEEKDNPFSNVNLKDIM